MNNTIPLGDNSLVAIVIVKFFNTSPDSILFRSKYVVLLQTYSYGFIFAIF